MVGAVFMQKGQNWCKHGRFKKKKIVPQSYKDHLLNIQPKLSCTYPTSVTVIDALLFPQREVAQIDQFLQETAAREANAKVRLQQFIEELLDRADRAEKQLQIISSCGTTPNGSLGRCSLQASKGNGRQVRMLPLVSAVVFSCLYLLLLRTILCRHLSA